MLCQHCNNWTEIEYIDVIHEYQGKDKKYYSIPKHKCKHCGAGRVSLSVYQFMDKNIDNNKQYICNKR